MPYRYIHHPKHFRPCLRSGDTICFRTASLALSQSFKTFVKQQRAASVQRLFANEQAMKDVGFSKIDYLWKYNLRELG